MTKKYQLPCTCGEILIVDAQQAGETVACPCGIKAEVPSLRELAHLEPAPAAAAPAASGPSWSVQQGWLFVAGLVLIAASVTVAVPAVYDLAVRLRLEKPEFENFILRDIDTYSLVETWQLWQYIESDGIEDRWTPRFIEQRALARRKWWIVGGCSLGAAAGLALAASAFVIRPSSR